MAANPRVSVAARPDPIEIDAARAALIVVDMQNDFGAEGGMFHRAGIDIAPIAAVVEPTGRVIAACRAAGIPVIYLQMQHRADLADMGPRDAPHRQRHERLAVGTPIDAPDGSAGRILVEGTWGTRILDALAPGPGDILVPKHRFSGFFETPLDSILRGLGAKYLVFTGCTTSVCVESTLRDAMFRDYHCILLEDCCAEPIGAGNARSNHEASLLTVEVLFGWVSESRALTASLAAITPRTT